MSKRPLVHEEDVPLYIEDDVSLTEDKHPAKDTRLPEEDTRLPEEEEWDPCPPATQDEEWEPGASYTQGNDEDDWDPSTTHAGDDWDLPAQIEELRISTTDAKDAEEEERGQTHMPVSELTYVQTQLRGMYQTLRLCRLQLHSVSQAQPPKEDWGEKGLPHWTWQATQDLLFADDSRPACAHKNKCMGIEAQLSSVYMHPESKIDLWPGKTLPAAFGPDTPCALCLVHQTHAAMFLFLVNRIPLRGHEPFQAFFHSDEDFHPGMLLRPDNSAFNGLVAPVMMFVHDKLVWDFDTARRQWFVNISAYKRPEGSPGVQIEGVNRNPRAHLKEPKK